MKAISDQILHDIIAPLRRVLAHVKFKGLAECV